MCGSLHYGKDPTLVAKIGDPVPVINLVTGESGTAVWGGFAKQEKTAWWQEAGNPVPVVLSVDTFIEGNTEFRIPTGEISGIGLTRDVLVYGKRIGIAKTIKIMTRAASSALEKSIHSRWPIVFHPSGSGVHIFENKDIVHGQQELR